METLVWIAAAVSLVLLLAVGVGAWWQHRTCLNEMQRRLAWTEQARFALERHAQEVDQRLAAISQALESLQAQRPSTAKSTVTPAASSTVQPTVQPTMPQAGLPPDDASERRRLMLEALDRADASAAAELAVADPAQANPWRETEPLPLADTFYAPTMPLELQDEPRVFPPRQTKKTSVRQ